MNIEADHRGKIYRRVENGAVDFLTVKEALAIVNHAMMGGQSEVREMSSQHGRHMIEYKSGTTVSLVEMDAPAEPEATEDTAPWTVASRRFLLHKFTEAGKNGRAVCNKSFRPRSYADGYDFRTRAEHEASRYAHLYTFCRPCEKK